MPKPTHFHCQILQLAVRVLCDSNSLDPTLLVICQVGAGVVRESRRDHTAVGLPFPPSNAFKERGLLVFSELLAWEAQ